MYDVLEYLGIYRTESRAVNFGLTHHGSLYGIPVYVQKSNVSVAAKVPLLELVIDVMEWVIDQAEQRGYERPEILGLKIGKRISLRHYAKRH